MDFLGMIPNKWFWPVLNILVFGSPFGLISCSPLDLISTFGEIVNLESTDTTPEVPHPCSTRLPARRTAFVFFFFFPRIHADSARFAPMRLDSCRIGFDSCRTGLIRPYRVLSAAGRYSWNTPKTAEIGLEYGRKSRNLHSSFFFCESRHSMCFLIIF